MYTTTPYTTTQTATMPTISPVIMIIYLAIIVVELVAMWKIYAKAGQPGWAVIVPIYNIIILLKIVEMDWWHILIMLFVPFAAVVYMIIIYYKLAIVFGKGSGFGVLNIFFSAITCPILGFGSAEYVGSSASVPMQNAAPVENMNPVDNAPVENTNPTDNNMGQ